jgi:myo-inositol-1(or 4)-monophosphatase
MLAGFRAETRLAIAAVQRGLLLAEQSLGASEIASKGIRDLVTATDIAVEDSIREVLAAASFRFPVVGEERGGEPPADGSPYWLVDPICGTTSFAWGIPLYCVNLALVEGGRVSVSAVADASRHELAFAELGVGAWTVREDNAQRLAVSDESCTIVIEDGKSGEPTRDHAARFIFEALSKDRWEFLSLNTSLALPYLAAGRIAANVVFLVTAVHGAAGAFLAAEAGATVSDIHGTPWSVNSESLIAAATPALHDELLALARDTSPPTGRAAEA